MNPGPATLAEVITAAGSEAALASSDSAMAVAIAAGAILSGRASLRARLVAKSPWSGLAGRSTSTSTSIASGPDESVPRATASIHAARTLSRTRPRIVGDVSRASSEDISAMVAATRCSSAGLCPWIASEPSVRGSVHQGTAIRHRSESASVVSDEVLLVEVGT